MSVVILILTTWLLAGGMATLARQRKMAVSST
jgi:hypothetical protein